MIGISVKRKPIFHQVLLVLEPHEDDDFDFAVYQYLSASISQGSLSKVDV